ncbi:hypothetical protein [Neomoorella mulderi]|uniref:Uncharacterized protein n=1 Tax=Moorella mulderi DSM 14980 TaxID=1122241 RepID=A0A151B0H7_9FIRM|nr:hypothetical protein [Moorella mulderi]KYH33330.1 hypothetical protein MOMUL_00310 [Moorella mulderi DSM 14980]
MPPFVFLLILQTLEGRHWFPPLRIIQAQRARTMAITMETRGFGAGPRISLRTSTFRRLDPGVISGCLFLTAALVVVALR